MLKLARREGESLMIGDKIKVKILETNGEYVEIGIDAPEDMIILRTELYEKFKATMDETV